MTRMPWGRSLTVQPDCLKGRVVCRAVVGHVLKRSPVIIRKSRVLCPSRGFLSTATYPSIPKKHYNGLINIINHCDQTCPRTMKYISQRKCIDDLINTNVTTVMLLFFGVYAGVWLPQPFFRHCFLFLFLFLTQKLLFTPQGAFQA